MSRTLMLLLVMATAVLLAGCHEGSRLAGEQEPVGGRDLEQDIAAGIAEELDVDVEVACPGNVTERKGDEFECTAEGSADEEDGGDFEFPVEVRQTDNEGNVDWNAKGLPTSPVEDSIEGEIFSQRAVRVEITCPEAVTLEEGHEFDCTARDDAGGEEAVIATVTDEQGNVTWRIPTAEERAADETTGETTATTGS